MRVLLSTYGSRGDAEPMVGLAVRLRALGAEVRACAPPDFADVPRRAAELVAAQFDTVAAVAEGCAGGGRHDAGRGEAMTEHAVVIAGGGPTGADVGGRVGVGGGRRCHRRAERQPGPPRLARRRSAFAHHRGPRPARGTADRFLSEGQAAQVAGFAGTPLDISDFPTRHDHGLGLWQKHIERILASWVREEGADLLRQR